MSGNLQEMSDPHAYNLAKTLYEHLPELQHTISHCADISIKEATKQVPWIFIQEP